MRGTEEDEDMMSRGGAQLGLARREEGRMGDGKQTQRRKRTKRQAARQGKKRKPASREAVTSGK